MKHIYSPCLRQAAKLHIKISIPRTPQSRGKGESRPLALPAVSTGQNLLSQPLLQRGEREAQVENKGLLSGAPAWHTGWESAWEVPSQLAAPQLQIKLKIHVICIVTD